MSHECHIRTYNNHIHSGDQWASALCCGKLNKFVPFVNHSRYMKMFTLRPTHVCVCVCVSSRVPRLLILLLLHTYYYSQALKDNDKPEICTKNRWSRVSLSRRLKCFFFFLLHFKWPETTRINANLSNAMHFMNRLQTTKTNTHTHTNYCVRSSVAIQFDWEINQSMHVFCTNACPVEIS